MYCFGMVAVLLLLVIVQTTRAQNRLKQTRFLERYIEKNSAAIKRPKLDEFKNRC